MVTSSGIIKISEMASLALHGMALIATSEQGVLSVKTIAKELNASEAHLAKVFQRLVKAGLALSVRGPKGGYSLSLSPEKISLLDIYQAIEGIKTSKECPLEWERCPFAQCLFESFLLKVEEDFINYFRQRTLSDFLQSLKAPLF